MADKKISQLTPGTTLVGTEPIPMVQGGQTVATTPNAIGALIKPYKVYTALLTQTGTSAPVATVLENTLGDIIWTIQGVGQYIGLSSGLFTLNKTFILINDNYSSFTIPKPLGKITLDPHPSVNTTLILQTGGTTSVLNNGMLNGMLNNTQIEIRVYN